ncbi:hypothetical protein [Mucilaginibacter sp. JRF]|uniref:hypothetical protein n=1 Tax=Mucilaginibacter sp. JRF TaxID=2780088 RepID=UPI001D165719|nr:hypothetical protein [Mucilaginibacter sp. JRF]
MSDVITKTEVAKRKELKTIQQPAYEFNKWTNIEKVAFRVAFIFFGLFAIPLDIGFYQFIWNIDYSHLTYREINESIAFYNPQFINIFSEGGFFGYESYVNWPFVLLIAIAGAAIWTSLDSRSRDYNKLYYWVRVLVSYRVAYAAIAWGYKKIFIMQMPAGNEGLYNTEFIDFFAKRLYWEAIGVATKYEFFLGFAEFIGGFLLLFRKTRGIGAAVTFVVFGNIAIANHAYDIGEQVPSAGLALLSLFLMWYDLPAIWNLIVNQVNTRVVHYYPVFKQKWQNYIRLAVKWSGNLVYVILFFALEVYGYTHNDFYKLPNTPGLAGSKGYYNVTEFKLNGKVVPYSPFDLKRWQDAAFEEWSSLSFKVYNRPQQIEMFAAGSYPRNHEVYDGKWYFDWRGDVRRFGDTKKHKKYDPAKRDLNITWELSGLGGRQYYYYKADTINHVLHLVNKNKAHRDQTQELHYSRPTKDRVILWGRNEFKDSIYVVLDRTHQHYPIKNGRNANLSYTP